MGLLSARANYNQLQLEDLQLHDPNSSALYTVELDSAREDSSALDAEDNAAFSESEVSESEDEAS